MTNSEQPPTADDELWIAFQEAELHEVADQSPLAGAPELLREVRQLVETS